MINISLNELKLIAKSRSVKNKSKEYLLKVLSKQEPRLSVFKKKIEETKKHFSELGQV